MKVGELQSLESSRAWQECIYCKKGKVPRSRTDIWDDCPECEGQGGYWVTSFSVQVAPQENTSVVLDGGECSHSNLYADHDAGTIRCKDCTTLVELR